MQRVLLILASGISIGVAGFMILPIFQISTEQRLLDRNFYGVLKVRDTGTLEDRNSQRILTHGSIIHGVQFLQPGRQREPISYYHPDSGIGLAIRSRDSSHTLRVGIIGLGAGIISAYGRTGDVYRFFEINPLVVKIAKTEFTYLRDSRAKVEVILGDARLSLERETAQDYDIFILDAFSGDAIPIHLLTREAFQLYLHHLKKDGILALHISNRYIDLKPVIQRLSEKVGIEAIVVNSTGNPETGTDPAEWILLADRRETLFRPPIGRAGGSLARMSDAPVWTDDYSSLFRLLK